MNLVSFIIRIYHDARSPELQIWGTISAFHVVWDLICNIYIYICTYIYSEAFPLQARSGPEGSRKLRFPDFMTMAQDGGKVVSLTHRPPLPPGNAPGSHFC